MNDFLILIPPSEGKKSGGTMQPLQNLSQDVQYVIDQFQSMDIKSWTKVLGVKGRALDEAVQCNKTVQTSLTMPAIERYSGVVYSAIDYPTLDQDAKNFFDKHVRIVSALFGLLKPQDLIPNYKLKIDKLGIDKHWKPIHAEALKNQFVVDLLPQAHRKSIEYADGVAIEFFVLKAGKKIPSGHQGKHIKGRFIRWLSQRQVTDIRQFREFTEDGFLWDNLCFIKTK